MLNRLLEKLENAQAQAQKQLAEQLEWLKTHGGSDQKLERQAVASANRAESKRQQVTAVNKMIDANTAKNKEAISALVTRAVHAASDRAGEIYGIIAAWGNDPGDLKKTAANTALLDAVRKSRVLRDVSKYLGRFREMFVQGKRNGYTFGRGEKYSLELGNDLSRAVTSELAMLASPLTTPLFLRKYQKRQIKQYRRREPVYRGMGDIICCLDESDSTAGDPAA